jgi:hypothetical protein
MISQSFAKAAHAGGMRITTKISVSRHADWAGLQRNARIAGSARLLAAGWRSFPVTHRHQLNGRVRATAFNGSRQASRIERPVAGFEAQLGDEIGAFAGLDAPKVLGAVRRQLGIADSRLNAAVPETRLLEAWLPVNFRQSHAALAD